MESKELSTLSEWLDYVESLHSKEIEFGLKRVTKVYQSLFPKGLSATVVTVAGTNGKGTTCAYIENILLAAGESCGKHTSPHLIDFNERINIAGKPVDDDLIIRAFIKVEKYRQNIELTYFEFTFLAALCVFEECKVDFAICEVGLGGRLDAVNILSPEVSVITMVGLDHTDWLGDDLQSIAVEKAGIARQGKPCVVGMIDFPQSGIEYLQNQKAAIVQNGLNYIIDTEAKEILESGTNEPAKKINTLPVLAAQHLYENAACAVMAVKSLQEKLSDKLTITESNIYSGIEATQVIGRCQVLQSDPMIVLDVAHNEDSIKALTCFLDEEATLGKTVAVFSMLKDKDIKASLAGLIATVDIWYISELLTDRAMSVDDIQRVIYELDANAKVVVCESIGAAFLEAKKTLLKEDCLVVFGSFWVVGDILRLS